MWVGRQGRLSAGSRRGCQLCRHLCSCHRERQADGVPLVVLVERTAREGNVVVGDVRTITTDIAGITAHSAIDVVVATEGAALLVAGAATVIDETVADEPDDTEPATAGGKASGHTSFTRWMTTLRIEEAKRVLLEHPDWTNEAVADHCGFSRAYFQKIFKQETGMAPSAFIS